MEEQERRRHSHQAGERRRREQERQERERRERARREQERQRRQRQRAVRRQLLLLAAGILGLVLLVLGISTVRARQQEAREQRAEEAAQAAQKEQEAREKEEKAREEEQAAEEMAGTMENLEETLQDDLQGYNGTWSVYVKELEYDNSFSLNSQGMYPASLIKLFAMAAAYENMDQVLDHEASYLGSRKSARDTVQTLLENMIEISDNESYNELVKLQSPDRDFTEGASIINDYLQEEGYQDTAVHTTLHPAVSRSVKDGLGDNVTSVEDCGKLLEKIYEGNCGSQEESGEMLHLLLNQENTLKIPGGLPKGVKVAHKTGETSEVQHDAGIIYGEKTDFILCIMIDDVGNAAQVYSQIHELTEKVYDTLNG